MVLNKFWSLKEFCLGDAASLGGFPGYVVYTEIMHADLTTLYLGFVGLLGRVMKERIDPVIALVLFELGFQFRRDILSWFPSLLEIITTTALADFEAGAVPGDEHPRAISPMMLWGLHQMIPIRVSFVAASLFPIFSTLVPLSVIEMIRKIIHKRTVLPTKVMASVSPHSGDSTRSTDADIGGDIDAQSPKAPSLIVCTHFELATGARLADQFGLLGDYDNYVFIKDMRFASADDVFSNGFVIVGTKFLVQIEDLPTILLMKLLRSRVRDVHVYDVDGFSVGAMARLVYPETMTLRDLAHLSICILM